MFSTQSETPYNVPITATQLTVHNATMSLVFGESSITVPWLQPLPCGAQWTSPAPKYIYLHTRDYFNFKWARNAMRKQQMCRKRKGSLLLRETKRTFDLWLLVSSRLTKFQFEWKTFNLLASFISKSPMNTNHWAQRNIYS